MAWVRIPVDVARRHPLYGFDGWLLALYLLWLLVAVLLAAGLRDPLPLAGSLDATQADLAMIGMGVLFAAVAGVNLSFLVLAPSLRPAMPPIVIACAWLQQGVGLAGGALLAGGPWMPVKLVLGISLPVVFTLYLLRSRRVNVTYRHRVRPGDPVLDPPAETEPPEPLIVGLSAPG